MPFDIGLDRAEAITAIPTILQKQAWLVLYDAPSAARQVREQVVVADMISHNTERN